MQKRAFEEIKTAFNKKFANFFVFFFISIAVACIIILLSIVSTVKRQVLSDIENIGANVLELAPVVFDKNGQILSNIVYEDLMMIKRKCKYVKRVAMYSAGDTFMQSQEIKIEGEKRFSAQGVLIGTLPDYRKIKCLKMIKGRFINELDTKMERRVCVLGNTLYTFLGRDRVLGKRIKIEGCPESFTVIGGLARVKPFTLPMVGFDFWFGNNGTMFIPYSVIKEVVKPKEPKHKGFLGDIFIQVVPSSNKLSSKGLQQCVRETEKKITNLLCEKYGKDKEFKMHSSKKILDELEMQTYQANRFIGIIGATSLIGSVIGILSMMLFSVSSRTSEIGIRRAIGARKRDIFFQFLREGIIITSKGGIGGIILGLLIVYLLGKYTGWEMVVPIYSLFLSIATIALIAVISGVYPALKAANIPPAQAVKYE